MKAAQVYNTSAQSGWEAAMVEHHPNYAEKAGNPVTVGEYLEEA